MMASDFKSEPFSSSAMPENGILGFQANFKCIICSNVFIETPPIQCRSGHTFCYPCIDNSTINGLCLCPIDNELFVAFRRIHSVTPDNETHTEDCVASQPQIRCQYFRPPDSTTSGASSDSCSWMGTTEAYKEHVCPFKPLRCRNAGCNMVIQRRNALNHIKECNYRMYNCKVCNNTILFGDRFSHKDSCNGLVPCPKRCCDNLVVLRDHALECPLVMVDCPFYAANTQHSLICTGRIFRCEMVTHVQSLQVASNKRRLDHQEDHKFIGAMRKVPRSDGEATENYARRLYNFSCDRRRKIPDKSVDDWEEYIDDNMHRL